MEHTVLIIDGSESVRSHVRQVLADRGVFRNFINAADGVEGPHPGIESTADLVKAADGALYEAKRAGRNRVVAAP